MHQYKSGLNKNKANQSVQNMMQADKNNAKSSHFVHSIITW